MVYSESLLYLPLAGGVFGEKIGAIQEALEHCLAQITSQEHLLPLVLAKAAKRRRLSLSELELQRLSTAVLNADGSVLHIDLDPPCAFGETEEEIQAALQGLFDELIDSISEIEQNITDAVSNAIPNAIADVAELIGKHILDEAHENTLQLRKTHIERAKTVRRMWGNAIEQLDFLRHMVLEWDSVATELRQGCYTHPDTAFALNKLNRRAYEIVGEIITLGQSGYADGALARWRSLHEICVIAMFLAARSDRCAQMYLSHHVIEELRLFYLDNASGTATAINALRDRYARDLRKQKTEMVKRFGKAFAGDYGWASVELGQSKTTFRDLEKHVGLETLRRGYQQANSTVHGGALATLSRISLGPSVVDSSEVPPAYGCEVAANYAAASLSMMVAELCLKTENADLIAMNMVIYNCASKLRELLARGPKNASDDSARFKSMMRKSMRRKFRVKPTRIS